MSAIVFGSKESHAELNRLKIANTIDAIDWWAVIAETMEDVSNIKDYEPDAKQDYFGAEACIDVVGIPYSFVGNGETKHDAVGEAVGKMVAHMLKLKEANTKQ